VLLRLAQGDIYSLEILAIRAQKIVNISASVLSRWDIDLYRR